jgi:alkylated DNA repair dioxygenase AlkB
MPLAHADVVPRISAPPAGFRYRLEFLDPSEERELVARFQDLPFKPFEFQGYLARRRVVAYWFSYDYGERALQPAPEIPGFLRGVRERAAAFAALAPADLVHAVVTEYSAGTPIGWHRDRPVFGDVIGISLLSACVFRFRRKAVSGWDRYSLTAEPRSIYLMRGPARTEWEHSIPEVPEVRYSITFRTLRAASTAW